MQKRLRRIPGGSIKAFIPDVRQNTNFSCGAAALHAVCAYWGVGPDSEYDYMKNLHTDPDFGTLPQEMIKFAQNEGLKVEARQRMTIIDIKTALDRTPSRPVIVLIQAYGDPKTYRENDNGHYVVAVGYDDGHIYFEDPILFGIRGELTYKEFDLRWHDDDGFGNIYDHYGIIAWGTDDLYLSHATKIV